MSNFLSADIRLILGSLGILLGFIAYYPYIRDIIKRKTKPHAFSWIIWTILSSTICAVQILEGGGVGAFVTAVAALMSAIVAVFGLVLGDRTYRLIDFASLAGAGIALLLWWKNNDPTLPIILLSIINAIGFIPSIRKAFINPYSETLSAWWIMIFGSLFGIAALEIWIFNTAFYVTVNAIYNFLFILFLLVLRHINQK